MIYTESDISKVFSYIGLPQFNDLIIGDGLIIEYSGALFNDFSYLLRCFHFREGAMTIRKDSNGNSNQLETNFKHQKLNYCVVISSLINKFGVSTLLSFEGSIEDFINILTYGVIDNEV